MRYILAILVLSSCSVSTPPEDKPAPRRHQAHRSQPRKASLGIAAEVPTAAPVGASKYDSALSSVVVVSSSTATGSGFCVSSTKIVTNAHVVGRDRRVSVLSRSRDKAAARVVRTDTRRDLALLKAPGVCRQWLTLADPSEEIIGTDLIVVGAPKGLSWSVARGIVSAVRMPRGFTEIQTDAPINPGNSGGPLVSAETGRVLGVVTSAYKSQWEGLGFAVGADEIGRAFPGLRLR